MILNITVFAGLVFYYLKSLYSSPLNTTKTCFILFKTVILFQEKIVIPQYSDYPDAYTAWNVISSIGSIISFVGVIIFIFIIWEILFPTQTRNSIEWFQNTPPAEHSYSELPSQQLMWYRG